MWRICFEVRHILGKNLHGGCWRSLVILSLIGWLSRDFLPAPKVDSSVVIIQPKDQIPGVNLDEWCEFTKTCFEKKNTTLGVAFKQKVIELFRLSKMASSNREEMNRN
jgi:16S rRNA A1518/A1519 N6-dimethyltransferase RsmA/KsgA/DIM1 with predicted DNA glycosylase/AP lyase activity